MIAALDPSQLTPLGRIDQAVGAVQHRTASAIWRGRRSAPDTFCIGVFEGRRQGLFCRLAIDCHSRYAGSSLYLNDALEVIGVRRSLRAAGRLVTSLEFEIAQLSEMQGWSGPEIAVLAAACVREGIGIRVRQTRRVIQLAVGQQPSISGDRGSAKWQLNARDIDGSFIRNRRAIAAIEPTKGNALIADFEGCSDGQLFIGYIG